MQSRKEMRKYLNQKATNKCQTILYIYKITSSILVHKLHIVYSKCDQPGGSNQVKHDLWTWVTLPRRRLFYRLNAREEALRK